MELPQKMVDLGGVWDLDRYQTLIRSMGEEYRGITLGSVVSLCGPQYGFFYDKNFSNWVRVRRPG